MKTQTTNLTTYLLMAAIGAVGAGYVYLTVDGLVGKVVAAVGALLAGG